MLGRYKNEKIDDLLGSSNDEKCTLPLLEVFAKRKLLVDFEPKRGVKDYQKFLDTVKPLIDKI